MSPVGMSSRLPPGVPAAAGREGRKEAPPLAPRRAPSFTREKLVGKGGGQGQAEDLQTQRALEFRFLAGLDALSPYSMNAPFPCLLRILPGPAQIVSLPSTELVHTSTVISWRIKG